MKNTEDKDNQLFFVYPKHFVPNNFHIKLHPQIP